MFKNLEPFERFQLEKYGNILPPQKYYFNQDDREADFYAQQKKDEVYEYNTYYNPQEKDYNQT